MNNMQDAGPSSPSKGKSSDTGGKSWRAGWWDFYPVLETPKRAIQWSNSSLIFTADPTQPRVNARHFSSSKQFVLPPPPPIVSSYASYEPPSVISASPNGEWLFSYFPRRDNDGTGCLWKRGPQIDNWQVQDSWSFVRSGGVVAVSWLTSPREWVSNSSGEPMRLPPRGPQTPISKPTLLLVTQDNCIHLTYYRQFLPGIRTMKRSLSFNGLTLENAAGASEVPEGQHSPRQCMRAAIDISILVATNTRRMPSSTPPCAPIMAPPPFNSMDLSVPITIPETHPQDHKPPEWDAWGEDNALDIYEIQLRFDGLTMNHGSLIISDISFMCAPPPAPTSTQTESSHERSVKERGRLYLTVTSVGLKEYSSLPTSKIILYSVICKAPNPRGSLWATNAEASKIIERGVVTHLESFVDFSTPSHISIYAYTLDNSGSLALGKSRPKEVPIGSISVLNVPDLTDNLNYEQTSISHPYDFLGRNLPLFAAVSPNRRLLCALSSTLWRTKVSIHPLPKASTSSIPPFSPRLACSILARISSEDIVHSISAPQVPLSEATEVMRHTLDVLEKFKSETPYSATWDIMGVATEVYRTRAQAAKNEQEAEMLRDRWQTALDVCSIAACNTAFDDCKEDGGYDLDAAWRIVGMCTWVVNLTEKLMKACVLSSNVKVAKSPVKMEEPEPTVLLDPTQLLTAPILLHLAHPFALQNLLVALKHVKAFRTYLGSLPAGGENPKMAQTILIDAVDSSGVDFAELITALEEAVTATHAMDAQECQKALASCQPTAVMHSHLARITQKISDSETLLNKSTLFIKPYDLLDGIARLSLEGNRKSDEKDIIAKGPLFKQGPRCVMPKTTLASFPVSGLFGVVKPSGPTSMSIVNDLQQLLSRSRLFVDPEKLEKLKGKKPDKRRGRRGLDTVKIGQGGTLDPLADGVLVIGVGKGTKKLNEFLNCIKEYRTTCLLGCETDSYDSEGACVRLAPWHHVTQDKVQAALPKFTGEIKQVPPIFSALKMDGKPLYEYARKGLPLPRPIEARCVTVHSLEILDWLGSEHSFSWPEKHFSTEEKQALETALKGIQGDVSIKDEVEPTSDDERPTAFALNMKVSGGTYVRSIVHDLAHSVDSAGHVVTLTRSRQGRFTLEPIEEGDRGCIPWTIFKKALTDLGEVDDEGWTEWEREVIQRLEVI
ncbi:hypothetical protein NLJ89_g668 [Agrocybe chaxingu]|uniref:tRNA pseudouridine(55) synthase n=1 Tax=Agrocybe chaxingu TaxID=84603 RepID=A0A9W8N1J4_9AGAR|nr:hypothetical protein NLJ89_g668 [Agrocybe chaxingu]